MSEQQVRQPRVPGGELGRPVRVRPGEQRRRRQVLQRAVRRPHARPGELRRLRAAVHERALSGERLRRRWFLSAERAEHELLSDLSAGHVLSQRHVPADGVRQRSSGQRVSGGWNRGQLGRPVLWLPLAAVRRRALRREQLRRVWNAVPFGRVHRRGLSVGWCDLSARRRRPLLQPRRRHVVAVLSGLGVHRHADRQRELRSLRQSVRLGAHLRGRPLHRADVYCEHFDASVCERRRRHRHLLRHHVCVDGDRPAQLRSVQPALRARRGLLGGQLRARDVLGVDARLALSHDRCWRGELLWLGLRGHTVGSAQLRRVQSTVPGRRRVRERHVPVMRCRGRWQCHLQRLPRELLRPERSFAEHRRCDEAVSVSGLASTP